MQNTEYQLYDYYFNGLPIVDIKFTIGQPLEFHCRDNYDECRTHIQPFITPAQCRCGKCGWKGIYDQCIKEQADDHYQYMCPVCKWNPVADLT